MKESNKKKIYKSSFLVNYRDQLIPIATQNIAYFYLENQIVYCKTKTNERYRISSTLEKLQNQLDPTVFFRVNRQCIISKPSVKSATNFENRKLKLVVLPELNSEIIISKGKVPHFKVWMKS